jgi:hypothetical protein
MQRHRNSCLCLPLALKGANRWPRLHRLIKQQSLQDNPWAVESRGVVVLVARRLVVYLAFRGASFLLAFRVS